MASGCSDNSAEDSIAFGHDRAGCYCWTGKDFDGVDAANQHDTNARRARGETPGSSRSAGFRQHGRWRREDNWCWRRQRRPLISAQVGARLRDVQVFFPASGPVMLRTIGIAIWIAVALPDLAMAQRGAAFYNGDVIYQWCTSSAEYLRSRCMAYIVAVADGMAGPSGLYRRTACIPLSVTGEQFIAVAVRYLREHAAERDNIAANLIASALSQAFPCR
jgi:hypothetical protein